jgi:hypothetical protein
MILIIGTLQLSRKIVNRLFPFPELVEGNTTEILEGVPFDKLREREQAPGTGTSSGNGNKLKEREQASGTGTSSGNGNKLREREQAPGTVPYKLSTTFEGCLIIFINICVK